jgi:heme oxygenase
VASTEAPASLRDALRRSTAAAHRALEATTLMRAVVSGVPDRDVYVAYLTSHWRVHVGLETLLAGVLPARWTRGRLDKSAWLRADLRAMRQPVPQAPVLDVPAGSIAQALGVMYVLEGATLGLSIVTRRLPASHPALDGAGRFMAAYGQDTGSRWSAFQRMLATVPPEEWSSSCVAARATFSTFQRVFDTAWPVRAEVAASP